MRVYIKICICSQNMKSTFSKCIMLMYHMEVCIHGLYIFFPHFVVTQFFFRNAYDFAKHDNKGTMQPNIKKLGRSLSTVDVRNALGIYQTKSNMRTCHEVYKHGQISNNKDHNVQEYSDLTSNDDHVQLQYLKLPYPGISYNEIREEYKYYLHQNNNYYLSSYNRLELEYLNHYLYRGQNNFEYVFIFNCVNI